MPKRRGRTAGAAALILVLMAAGAAWRFREGLGLAHPVGPLDGGLSAYDRGDWASAATAARDRLVKAPKDADALRLFARATARLGRDDVAQAAFGRLGAKAWGAEDYVLLGGIVDRKGMYDLAVDAWRVALEKEPDRPDALAAFVALNRKVEAFEEAAALAERLAKRPGWNARGLALLAELRAKLGDHASAVDCLRKALAGAADDTPRAGDPFLLPEPAALRLGLARALLHLGKADEAEAALRDAGAGPEAAWLHARAAIQRGDRGVGAEIFEASNQYRDEHPLEPEPAPFVGSVRCAECHRSVAGAAGHARHSQTFSKAAGVGDLPLPPAGTPDPVAPGASHSVSRVKDGSADVLRWETRVDGQTFRAIVDYAVGSGDRGVSLVGRDDSGKARELRLSRYHDEAGAGVWDLTTGHTPKPTADADYLGRPLSADQARGCLACHVTDPFSYAKNSGPVALDRAIGCERCHGPGGNHVAAVTSGPVPNDLAIAAAPGLAEPSAVNRQCGECHSLHSGATVSPDDPISVRFQADTLVWSRCYTESGESLSCLTCHDPHRNAKKSAGHYESRCLACHTGAAPAGPEVDAPHASKACPVNPRNGCLTCHMPVVRPKAIPHTPFTDHHIRVRRDEPAAGR